MHCKVCQCVMQVNGHMRDEICCKGHCTMKCNRKISHSKLIAKSIHIWRVWSWHKIHTYACPPLKIQTTVSMGGVTDMMICGETNAEIKLSTADNAYYFRAKGHHAETWMRAFKKLFGDRVVVTCLALMLFTLCRYLECLFHLIWIASLKTVTFRVIWA